MTTPETVATLVINVTSSYCGNCRQPVMPQATHHTDVCGWTPKRGGGCGARFVDTDTDYVQITDNDLRRIRPDLPTRRTNTPAPAAG